MIFVVYKTKFSLLCTILDGGGVEGHFVRVDKEYWVDFKKVFAIFNLTLSAGNPPPLLPRYNNVTINFCRQKNPTKMLMLANMYV